MGNSKAQENYDVECFRTLNVGRFRYGVWVMTRKTGSRGMFVHGDRCEVQAPHWTVEELRDGEAEAVPISCEQALKIVSNWPEVQTEMQKCFDRHIIQNTPASHESEASNE